MSDTINPGTVRLFGAGGAGINIAGIFNNASVEPNCAQIKPAYIDTSRSNLRDDFPESETYILEGVDGSGKVRRENHQAIADNIKQMLKQIDPGDLNIVIFSASGGSGAVAGPLLVQELLQRNLSTIALVIGTGESTITADNTQKTLKSLDSIARRAEKPVVMFYEDNVGRRRSEVDGQLKLAISTLAILACKTNREIDTKDIANWLNFSFTTSVGPQLAQLEIFNDAEVAMQVEDPISIASIYTDPDDDPLPLTPEYHAAGYLKEPAENFTQLHFVISTDALPTIASQIKSKLDDMAKHRGARVNRGSILDEGDDTTEDGLVL